MNILSTKRFTHLLVLLLIAGAGAAALAWGHFIKSREGAIASRNDLSLCRQDLADLDAWHATPAAENGSATSDPDLNLRLRAAATVARMSDQLVSIEPGPALRLRDSDALQTPIYLRLNAVTLRQLINFLHQLSSADSSLRTSAIEMTTPDAATAVPGESNEPWTADITLSYLTHSIKTPPAP